jgi:hypothetical protein
MNAQMAADMQVPMVLISWGWKKVGNITILKERYYDHVSACTTTEWRLIQDGRMFKASCVIRLYTFSGLSKLLERFGFRDFGAYGSLDLSRFRLGPLVSTWSQQNVDFTIENPRSIYQ